MTHPQTIRDLQRILDQIDDELGKLRALVAKGEELRETLVKQLAATAWKENSNPIVIRIVGNDP